jgi:excisionase family DNA binding protein
MVTPDPPGNGQQPEPGEPPEPKGRLLTPAEVAQILGGNTTAGTIVRRWRAWKLPAHRVGRELRFFESDVYTWIKNHRA